MIRKIFYFLFFVFAFSATGSSQNWAPTGSIWYYGILESFFSQNQGYLKVESIGDTMLQGNQCKILHKTRYHAFTHSISDEGNDYMYSANDIVYHFMNDTFYTLYNFNAMPGDTWTVAVPFPSPWNSPDTLVRVIVDSISTITIQSQLLKTLYVHSDSNDWLFLNPIIESLGSMGGMFPFIYSFMDMDIPFFRCYEDSTFFYQRNLNYPCDTVIDDIKDSDLHRSLNIYPNPADDNLHITIPPLLNNLQNALLQLYNVYGQLIFESQLDFEKSGVEIEIDTRNLNAGIYEVLLMTQDRYIIDKGKLVINHKY